MNQDVLTFAKLYLETDELKDQLARRIGYKTESQLEPRTDLLQDYLIEEIIPELTDMGFKWELLDNPIIDNCPFVIAERIEDPRLPTILLYGHGDVVFGDDSNWSPGLMPWELVERDGNWYGRGSADNKGQHTINFAALSLVLKAKKGQLGFNCKVLFEMGEEIASPGLAEIVKKYQQRLAADILIASDGPRLSLDQPTLFLGSRGCLNFKLSIHARDKDYHSGNWGGLLSNPAIELVNAIALLVDKKGCIQYTDLKPQPLSAELKAIFRNIPYIPQIDDPIIDLSWGEPDLSITEQLFGWNNLEILSFTAGNPEKTINAIPKKAEAICQLRFVVGSDSENFELNIRKILDNNGFSKVEFESLGKVAATRFEPENLIVHWVLQQIEKATNVKAVLLPNLGGTLPNDVFADILDLPTLWIPHSYPNSGQHGVDEHIPEKIVHEGFLIMSQIFDQLGAGAVSIGRESLPRND